MAAPIVRQGDIVLSIEVDRDGKPIIKRLRRIYTDAIGADGQIREGALQDAADEAIRQTIGQDIDGCDLKPLMEDLF